MEPARVLPARIAEPIRQSVIWLERIDVMADYRRAPRLSIHKTAQNGDLSPSPSMAWNVSAVAR